MAYDREDYRELCRMIRDDLIHLGLVDNDRAAPLAAGERASAGDLIVAGRTTTSSSPIRDTRSPTATVSSSTR